MKKLLLLHSLLLFVFLCHLLSFEDSKKELPPKELKLMLSGSQSAYSNWQEGGEDTLALTAEIKGRFFKAGKKWSQEHQFRFSLGIIKEKSNGLRKASDLILYRYSMQKLGKPVKPILDIEFRSQFARGKNYTLNPLEEDGPLPVVVSDFLAPAYISQTLGLVFTQKNAFKALVGLRFKETIVIVEKLQELYVEKENKALRLESGVSANALYNGDIAKNIRLQSRLDFFSSFEHLGCLDFRWENTLEMKVNSWLQITIDFEAFYDQELVDKVQFKELLSVGIIFDLVGEKKLSKKS